MDTVTDIKVNKRIFKAALKDVAKAAKAVNLIYVNNSQEGIIRKRRGSSFYYTDGTSTIKDKGTLERISKLVIPPAWENVWICKLENGHLQVTGTDKIGRKQYRYHPAWNAIRNQTKFYRLHEFGKQLPQMREVLSKNLALSGYPREKILALIVSLLERTNIRIGNAFYEKLYGSFGLTTMKNHHVNITGTKMEFSFKGKKGVQHKIALSSRKLANIVKACKDIPGKELFEYIDENGMIHKVDSGMVNEYIRLISGGDFSAKDFRTWAGTVQALLALKEIGDYETTTDMNRKIPAVFDAVAKQLGNTRTVCKKYYVHPAVIRLYEEKKLDHFFATIDGQNDSLLNTEEKILMAILEKQL